MNHEDLSEALARLASLYPALDHDALSSILEMANFSVYTAREIIEVNIGSNNIAVEEDAWNPYEEDVPTIEFKYTNVQPVETSLETEQVEFEEPFEASSLDASSSCNYEYDQNDSYDPWATKLGTSIYDDWDVACGESAGSGMSDRNV